MNKIPHCLVYDLTNWNQNKFIYHHLMKELDGASNDLKDQFSKFDYSLIQHTNLDNFFFELRQNYKHQYFQVEKLYLKYTDVIDSWNFRKDSPEGLAYHLLVTGDRIDPREFEEMSLQCQTQLKAGDIVDLKKCGALGYYLVYQPKESDILYIHKTRDEMGINLPSQAWPLIEHWGWSYYGNMPIKGCYLPKDCTLDRPRLQEKVKHGFLVFSPNDNDEDTDIKDGSVDRVTKSTKTYIINGYHFHGHIRELLIV